MENRIKKFEEFIKESSYMNDRFTSTLTEEFNIKSKNEISELFKAMCDENKKKIKTILGNNENVAITNCNDNFIEYLKRMYIYDNPDNFYFVEDIENPEQLEDIIIENIDKNIIISKEVSSKMIKEYNFYRILENEYVRVKEETGERKNFDKKIVVLFEESMDEIKRITPKNWRYFFARIYCIEL
jgi:hypothetical protein